MLAFVFAILWGISVALASPTAVSDGLNNSPVCGTLVNKETYAIAKKVLAENNVTHVPRAENVARGPTTINVYFHVIYVDQTIAGGYISDSDIATQMNVLNTFFNPVTLSFKIVKVDRTQNGNWFTFGGNPKSLFMGQMKQALRLGDVRDLNIYSVGFAEESGSFMSHGTFPWDYQSNPSNDGVTFTYSTLPGGGSPILTKARLARQVAVHAVGHWVGLLHTFEGGCNGGDMVDDTPAEASAASGCPIGRDTCPQPGLDPIDNFMDYTFDSCRTRFTNGQYSRLAQAVYQYRGINLY
ncbi:metalloprotease [Multifurca ochricompacta]|uniref:Metalloprotease n=1 Tax=Multifurca ochricompacta TaxID=376703 RepID=A0AAD4M1P0_9AGAM|nr:metalloprotease [Multifurca ochricompacta]